MTIIGYDYYISLVSNQVVHLNRKYALSNVNIKFSNDKATLFIKELKSQVQAYFDNQNISSKANGRMVIKTIVLLLVTFGAYALIVSNQVPLLGMWGLTFLMGLGVAGIGFSISHDALHGAYSSNKHVNRFLGLTFELLGASSYLWKIKHNVIHHTYTNIHGVDDDLEVSPLLRLSPGSPRYSYQKYQHIYAFIAYGFSTLHWVFLKDYKNLLRRSIGPYSKVKHPAKEIVLLLAMKIFYYLYMIVVPLIVLDITWWQFIIGFLTIHFTAGTILGVVFQLAHVVEGPEHFSNEADGIMEDAWLVHEMKTTANFAQHNKLLCWYVGGLNFQIEHHLFPKICSIHYPSISPIIRRVAKSHNVPYHYHPTLRKAILSHCRTLKQLGEEKRSPLVVPCVSNTH